jgi:hypothetical protein
MLIVSRKEGAFSTGDRSKNSKRKGNRGRLELFASKNQVDGTFCLTFIDYGNYGRERWSASFGSVSPETLDSMISALQALRNGSVDTTYQHYMQNAVKLNELAKEGTATATEVEDEVDKNARV